MSAPAYCLNMPGWERETTCIPIQDHIECQIQLRYTRQGITGNSPGIPRIEAIHERKPEASTCLNRPQELSNLDDNEGTK